MWLLIFSLIIFYSILSSNSAFNLHGKIVSYGSTGTYYIEVWPMPMRQRTKMRIEPLGTEYVRSDDAFNIPLKSLPEDEVIYVNMEYIGRAVQDYSHEIMLISPDEQFLYEFRYEDRYKVMRGLFPNQYLYGHIDVQAPMKRWAVWANWQSVPPQWGWHHLELKYSDEEGKFKIPYDPSNRFLFFYNGDELTRYYENVNKAYKFSLKNSEILEHNYLQIDCASGMIESKPKKGTQYDAAQPNEDEDSIYVCFSASNCPADVHLRVTKSEISIIVQSNRQEFGKFEYMNETSATQCHWMKKAQILREKRRWWKKKIYKYMPVDIEIKASQYFVKIETMELIHAFYIRDPITNPKFIYKFNANGMQAEFEYWAKTLKADNLSIDEREKAKMIDAYKQRFNPTSNDLFAYAMSLQVLNIRKM